MPYYPGGPGQVLTAVQKQLHYPAAAKAAKLQGRVFISFVVTEKGTVDKIKLMKGISAPTGLEAVARQMNEAALAAVRNLPGNWTPGKQGGKPAAVPFTIPVTFALQK